MKRLIEREFSPGALEAEAVELVRAAQGSEVVRAGAKSRVRARLLTASPRRGRRRPLRPALVVAAVTLGVAGAALATGLWRRIGDAPHPVTVEPSPSPDSPESKAAIAPSPSPPPVETAPAASNTSAAAPPTPAASAASRAMAPVPFSSSGRDQPAGEAALLYRAAQRLRRDGDSRGAARALDEYFENHPNGALGEEALALAIETSLARRDGRAPALARQYLQRFPNGNFRAQAERALRQKK